MKIELKILNKEFYKREKLGGTYYDRPVYATPESAALDLMCTEDVTLYPGQRKLLPTGLAIWIGSEAYKLKTQGEVIGQCCPVAGLILPRSGLGSKGLILANTIGLIDEDYQGELKISAWNTADYYFSLKAGDRIAQLMFVPVIKAQWNKVEEFSDRTKRDESGFGSTGI